ncbi:hypothetical protein ACFCV3_35025 [Kribbella sp. NPDC056345]|uniref:hypothetical protein n=1 Tax=Kribbella sp. NPDC056345 TaxID=3345789 RepID=UPI0035DD5D52
MPVRLDSQAGRAVTNLVGGTVLKERSKRFWERKRKVRAPDGEAQWPTKDIKKRRWPFALRAAEVTLFLLFAAVLVLYRGDHQVFVELPVRIAIGLAIIGALHLLAKRHLRRQLEDLDTPRFRKDVRVSNANAAMLLQRAGRSRYSPEQAKLFALAVTTPAAVRQRVVDTFVPGGRTLEQRATLEIQAPPELLIPSPAAQPGDADPHIVFVPVIIPKKGKLLDNFHLWDANGAQLTVLSYREYLDLAAGVLKVLLQELRKDGLGECQGAFERAERSAVTEIIARRHPDDDEEPSPTAKNISKRLRLLKHRQWAVHLHLSRTGDAAPEPAPAATSPAAWELVAALPVRSDPLAEALRGTIAAFVKILSESYCIAAAVRLDDQFRTLLTYEQTLIPDLDLSNSSMPWVADFIGRLRIAMGTRPPTLTLAVSNAFTCQSYHMRVGVGDNLYVSKQVPIEFGSLVDNKAPGAPTVPHMRFQRRLGQPHAHFYARYMPEPEAPRPPGEVILDGRRPSPEQDGKATEQAEPAAAGPVPVPRIRFVFAEVPPGSLIRATVAAGSAAATIWLIAFLSKFGGMDTDAPAYLLTFPAVIAAWMGFESQAGKRIEGTLRARLVLLFTALTSIAASGLFVAHKSVKAEAWPKLPDGYSLLGVADLWWAILVAASIANALYISYKYYVLTLQFTVHSTREQPGNSFIQHG